MSDEKKVKLVVPKSLMVVLWLIAGGLFVNVPFLKPVQEAWAAQLVQVVGAVVIHSKPSKPVYVKVVN